MVGNSSEIWKRRCYSSSHAQLCSDLFFKCSTLCRENTGYMFAHNWGQHVFPDELYVVLLVEALHVRSLMGFLPILNVAIKRRFCGHKSVHGRTSCSTRNSIIIPTVSSKRRQRISLIDDYHGWVFSFMDKTFREISKVSSKNAFFCFWRFLPSLGSVLFCCLLHSYLLLVWNHVFFFESQRMSLASRSRI